MSGSLTKDLTFQLLGKDVSASKSMSEVQKAGQEMSENIGSSMGSLGSIVGGEFGNILSEAGEGVENIGSHVKNLGSVIGAGGVAAAGAGVALQNYASGGEKATNQLEGAIKSAGGSYDKYSKQIEGSVDEGADFGDSAVDVKDALATLVNATGSTKDSLQDLDVAYDLAASKHISLGAAATQVGKILNGTGSKTLKQYGITMTAAVDPAKAVASAQKKVETTSTQLTSAQDKLTRLQTEYAGKTHLSANETSALQKAHDSVKTATNNHATAVQQLAAAQKQGTTNTQNAEDALGQLAYKVSGQASAASDTFSGKITSLRTHLSDWAEEMAGKAGPTLTALGGVATVTGTTMDLLKSTTLGARLAQVAVSASSGIATAAQWAWNAALDANPIGIVVLAIAALVAGLVWFFTQTKLGKEIWSDMMNGLAAGWKWLKSEVDFGAWGKAFSGMWDGIKGAASGAWSWLEGRVADFGNGIISNIDTVLSGINGAIGFIDKIPGVSIGRIPLIPHMASGGIVTSPTTILAGESGPEAIVPLNGGRLGGGGDITVIVQASAPSPSVASQFAKDIHAALLNAIRNGQINRTELLRALQGV